jgi:hypothetical protein
MTDELAVEFSFEVSMLAVAVDVQAVGGQPPLQRDAGGASVSLRGGEVGDGRHERTLIMPSKP